MEIIITCPSVIKTFNSLVSKCPYNAINGLQMQWGQILWEIIIFNCSCIFTRFYVTFKSMYVLQSFFQFQIRKCWVPWINHQVWKFASEVMAAIVSKQAGVTNQNQNYVYRKRRYITADKRGHLKNRIPYVPWCQSSVWK